MWSYKDKTFCASPDCENECGRKLTDQDKHYLSSFSDPENAPVVCYAYFCGEPESKTPEIEGIK